MTAKVVVKTVTDVAALQVVAPQLKIVAPSIPAGHPNEPAMAEAFNAAQAAPTLAMVAEAVGRGNLLGSTKTWRP